MQREHRALTVLRWLFCRFLILFALAALCFACADWLAAWRENILEAALTLCFGNF
ncbi:MAG: hypothetical protein IJW69_02505 [Clostridia bacterium]|nr:hypothetical protein [Clostridia bacterium]